MLLCVSGSRPELGLPLPAMTTTVLSDRSFWYARQCLLLKIYIGEPYTLIVQSTCEYTSVVEVSLLTPLKPFSGSGRRPLSFPLAGHQSPGQV